MYIQSSNIIEKNKETIINDIYQWIITNHPDRTTDHYKCERDLTKVVNGFIYGLKFGNKENMQFLVEEFYMGNTLRLKSTTVELEAYAILKDRLISLVDDNNAIKYIEYLYNELVTQLKNGPSYTNMSITKASLIAERCQRNWDYSTNIKTEDYNSIIQSAVSMPSKQNRQYYKLIVSTNINFNQVCYKYAIDPNNPDFDKPIHRNTQVLAPMLLLFMPTDPDKIYNPFNDRFAINFDQSIGIAAGVAAHSAAMLGYRTGFCACAIWEPMYIALNEQFGMPLPAINYGLMLGIGNPDLRYGKQDIVIDDNYVRTLDDSYDKIVDIRFF